MSIETMKLALETLNVYACKAEHKRTHADNCQAEEAITALRQAIQEASENGLYREGYRNGYGFGESAGLRQAIEQAQKQEPDKYVMDIECTKCGAKQSGILTVNTTPPQRQPEQEPVAWMFQHEETGRMNYVSNDGMNTPELFLKMNRRYVFVCALYTFPPQRQPLTDEQIQYAFRTNSVMVDNGNAYMVAGKRAINITRAIEAAYGIKGEA